MYEIFTKFTDIEDGNIAYHVPDTKENVDKNREKLALKYDFNLENLVYMNQVHGNNVQIVDENSSRFIDNCDGIITNNKNLTLMVMVADCIPILFMDKTKGVIAAVHAGRNSTFLKIAEITALKMMNTYSCRPDDIEVVMGPSIKSCCYEVSSELEQIVIETFGKEFANNRKIDLHGINKTLVDNLGIKNVICSDICTQCSDAPYFSYRKDKESGRFCGLIKIK